MPKTKDSSVMASSPEPISAPWILGAYFVSRHGDAPRIMNLMYRTGALLRSRTVPLEMREGTARRLVETLWFRRGKMVRTTQPVPLASVLAPLPDGTRPADYVIDVIAESFSGDGELSQLATEAMLKLERDGATDDAIALARHLRYVVAMGPEDLLERAIKVLGRFAALSLTALQCADLREGAESLRLTTLHRPQKNLQAVVRALRRS